MWDHKFYIKRSSNDLVRNYWECKNCGLFINSIANNELELYEAYYSTVLDCDSYLIKDIIK